MKWRKTKQRKETKIQRRIQCKQNVIDDLISKVSQFESERIKLLEDQYKLAKLYEMRVNDYHGDPLPFDKSESKI